MSNSGSTFCTQVFQFRIPGTSGNGSRCPKCFLLLQSWSGNHVKEKRKKYKWKEALQQARNHDVRPQSAAWPRNTRTCSYCLNQKHRTPMLVNWMFDHSNNKTFADVIAVGVRAGWPMSFGGRGWLWSLLGLNDASVEAKPKSAAITLLPFHNGSYGSQWKPRSTATK